MFHTNEAHLSLIAQSLSGAETKLVSQLPLSPSSTIVLEFTQDAPTSDLMVKAFIDDIETPLTGCPDPCKALDFQ